MVINEYRYQETIDWGIIKREWIHEDAEWIIVLEQHEEDRAQPVVSVLVGAGFNIPAKCPTEEAEHSCYLWR